MGGASTGSGVLDNNIIIILFYFGTECWIIKDMLEQAHRFVVRLHKSCVL